LNFSFQTAAAKGADDFSVGKKERLGSSPLRTGAFRAGNQGQGERPVRGGGEVFINAAHAPVLTRGRARFNGNFCLPEHFSILFFPAALLIFAHQKWHHH
jgi:hypothetical protein